MKWKKSKQFNLCREPLRVGSLSFDIALEMHDIRSAWKDEGARLAGGIWLRKSVLGGGASMMPRLKCGKLCVVDRYA